MNCDHCGSCCRDTYIVFLKSHAKEIIDKYHLDRMPGEFSDYGYGIVYWGNCPFLSSMNECTIYADRPSECRTFPVITWNDGRLKITNECSRYQTVTFKDVASARRENAKFKALLVRNKNAFGLSMSGRELLKQARRFIADLDAWEKNTPYVPCVYIDAETMFGKKFKDGGRPL